MVEDTLFFPPNTAQSRVGIVLEPHEVDHVQDFMDRMMDFWDALRKEFSDETNVTQAQISNMVEWLELLNTAQACAHGLGWDRSH